MADGARRFALQQLDKAATEVPELPTATVTAYPGPGGRVTVKYLGSTLHLRYLDSYAPAVGQKVLLARSGGNWLILGRPVP